MFLSSLIFGKKEIFLENWLILVWKLFRERKEPFVSGVGKQTALAF